jgi:hypothetical protein
MSLTPMATEVPVKEFRSDIQAQTSDGRVVIVENQLERTDRGHLDCWSMPAASGLAPGGVAFAIGRVPIASRWALDTGRAHQAR